MLSLDGCLERTCFARVGDCQPSHKSWGLPNSYEYTCDMDPSPHRCLRGGPCVLDVSCGAPEGLLRQARREGGGGGRHAGLGVGADGHVSCESICCKRCCSEQCRSVPCFGRRLITIPSCCDSAERKSSLKKGLSTPRWHGCHKL